VFAPSSSIGTQCLLGGRVLKWVIASLAAVSAKQVVSSDVVRGVADDSLMGRWVRTFKVPCSALIMVCVSCPDSSMYHIVAREGMWIIFIPCRVWPKCFRLACKSRLLGETEALTGGVAVEVGWCCPRVGRAYWGIRIFLYLDRRERLGVGVGMLTSARMGDACYRMDFGWGLGG